MHACPSPGRQGRPRKTARTIMPGLRRSRRTTWIRRTQERLPRGVGDLFRAAHDERLPSACSSRRAARAVSLPLRAPARSSTPPPILASPPKSLHRSNAGRARPILHHRSRTDPRLDAQPSYRALIGDALDLLYDVLRPFVEREMHEAYGPDWVAEARSVLHDKPPERWDTSDLLMLIYKRYFRSFREIGHEGRSRASLLKEVCTKWAHQADLTAAETRRALEDTIHLLRAVGADEEADRLEPQVLELMKAELTGSGSGVGRSLALEPLELRRDILDAVEDAVEPHRSNPALKGITSHPHSPDKPTKLRFESAIEGHERPFVAAVRRQLANAGLRDADRLRIRTRFHEAAWPYGVDPYAVGLH